MQMIDKWVVVVGAVIGLVLILFINRESFFNPDIEKVRSGSFEIQKKAVLAVKLTPWFGCQIGDIDVIETSVGPSTTLIATIQNLSDSKVLTKLDIRPDQILTERLITLPPTIAKLDGDYILSICTDGAKNRSCIGKKIADMKKLSSSAFQSKVLKRKIGKFALDNHLFVQQAFSIKDGRLVKTDNKSFAAHSKNKDAALVSKAMDGVDSMDLQYQVTPGRIEVHMPLRAYSSAFCNQQSEAENLRKALNSSGKKERIKPIEIPPNPFSL